MYVLMYCIPQYNNSDSTPHKGERLPYIYTLYTLQSCGIKIWQFDPIIKYWEYLIYRWFQKGGEEIYIYYIKNFQIWQLPEWKLKFDSSNVTKRSNQMQFEDKF